MGKLNLNRVSMPRQDPKVTNDKDTIRKRTGIRAIPNLISFFLLLTFKFLHKETGFYLNKD